MNLAQYVAGQQGRYKDFAELVEGMLETSIRENRQLRFQQVQSRAKNPVSLKGKLEKVGLLESNAIEDEIKDLAGCRLIFYTNSDVAAFLSSGIMYETQKIISNVGTDSISHKIHNFTFIHTNNIKSVISLIDSPNILNTWKSKIYSAFPLQDLVL